MKALKIIGIGLGVVVAVLIVTIAFLSPKTHMERSVEVNAQPEIIYNLINNFDNYNDWSPWAELDPATKYNYAGPASGPGARMSWSSEHDQVGDGEQWIIESRENDYVKYGIKFGGFEGDYTSEFILKPTENGTKITWTYNGDVSNESMMTKSMGKFFGMFMDGMLGPFYEKGLRSLKQASEERKAVPMPETIVVPDSVINN
jgi:hypothetical protein